MMTNDGKAQEIREDYTKGGYRETIYAADLEDALKEMADWKDQQFAEALAPILIELDELKRQIKSLLPTPKGMYK